MFAWLGRFSYRNRWRVLAVWAMLFVTGLVLAPRAGPALTSGFGEFDTESTQGLETLKRKLGYTTTLIDVVYASDTLTVGDPRFRQEVEQSLAGLEQFGHVRKIETFYNTGNSHLVSPDQRTTYAQVWLDLELDEAQDLVPEFRSSLGPTSSLTVWVTGSAPIFADLDTVIAEDLRRAEIITLPLVVIALLLVFGTAVAAGVPVLMGVISLAISFGVLFLLAQAMSVSVFSQNIVSFLGIGLAVDYALLTVSRFREELRKGASVEAAVVATNATAGQAIFFSGFTTMLGLGGLAIINLTGLRSMGIGGIIVVFVAMAQALTLMPAVLAIVGTKVNALRVLPSLALKERKVWAGLASWVMRHPLLVLLPVLAVLLVLGIPFLKVKLGVPYATFLPSRAESKQGLEHLNQKFGEGEVSPVLLAVTAPGDVLTPGRVGALYDYTRAVARLPGVTRIESIVGPDRRLEAAIPGLGKEAYQAFLPRPDAIPFPELREEALRALAALTSGDTTLVRVFTAYGANTPEGRELVRAVRSLAPGADLSVQVTGATAGLMDWTAALYREFPKSALFVVGSIYLALLLLFRSLVLPLKAVAMNFLSMTASFGALVFVFQQGHLEGLLNFHSEGFLEATVPVLLFCVLYGLSMDYEVFLLSRVKEEYDATGDNTASVAAGLERTGRVITSAAVILVIVAASFATGDNIIVKSLGVGVALAVFLDATVVRALLVPAAMRLLGKWNWWAPSVLKRWIPDLSGALHGGAATLSPSGAGAETDPAGTPDSTPDKPELS